VSANQHGAQNHESNLS
jgi:hypothetical protein